MSVDETRPVIERITQVLYTRLQVLLTDVYPNSPVVEVIRPSRTINFSPKSWQILLTNGGEERNEELGKPGNPPAVAYDATLNVHCHLMPSETDPTPIDEYQAVFYADVVEAITDGGRPHWFSFGALAINSNIGARQPIDSDGGIDGFTVPVEVCYRVSEWSPYEVRY